MELTKKVLVVDDEPLILYGLSKALENENVEVTTAATAKEAIEKVGSSFYNLCFLDICLPDLNGLEVMKKIQELSPHTKVAIMTAGQISEDMKRTIEEKAYLFIAKPFDLFQIRTTVKRALE